MNAQNITGVMEHIESFDDWRGSKKLRDANQKTGIFGSVMFIDEDNFDTCPELNDVITMDDFKKIEEYFDRRFWESDIDFVVPSDIVGQKMKDAVRTIDRTNASNSETEIAIDLLTVLHDDKYTNIPQVDEMLTMKNLKTFEKYFEINDEPAQHPTYTINYEFGKPKSITCHKCDMTSYSPMDIKHLYCGNCHEFHEPNQYDPNLQESKTFEASESRTRLQPFYNALKLLPEYYEDVDIETHPYTTGVNTTVLTFKTTHDAGEDNEMHAGEKWEFDIEYIDENGPEMDMTTANSGHTVGVSNLADVLNNSMPSSKIDDAWKKLIQIDPAYKIECPAPVLHRLKEKLATPKEIGMLERNIRK